MFLGFSGNATSIYDITLQIVRTILNANPNVRFGIGGRLNRVVSLEEGETRQIVPNIFQLSSGETSLLDLFLSLLRDFDLSGTSFSKAHEIRGTVIIDEIDLHLHANHQYTVLPSLLQLFPGVQFIFSTHSSTSCSWNEQGLWRGWLRLVSSAFGATNQPRRIRRIRECLSIAY